jgi:hypothetical protein
MDSHGASILLHNFAKFVGFCSQDGRDEKLVKPSILLASWSLWGFMIVEPEKQEPIHRTLMRLPRGCG